MVLLNNYVHTYLYTIWLQSEIFNIFYRNVVFLCFFLGGGGIWNPGGISNEVSKETIKNLNFFNPDSQLCNIEICTVNVQNPNFWISDILTFVWLSNSSVFFNIKPVPNWFKSAWNRFCSVFALFGQTKCFCVRFRTFTVWPVLVSRPL